MGALIDFKRPDGTNCKGWYAEAGKGKPGVIVIQEWWGLNDQICGVADRFARAGYNALAPDLYKGRVTQSPDEANHLMTGLDFGGAVGLDIRGAAQFLKTGGGKVAVMGFCMGGALTIATSVHVPEVSAGVCYYGIPPAEAADPRNLRVPLQAHFANTDDWCTPAAVNDLEKALKGAVKNFELFRYDAAHGFFNERRGDVYHAAAAQQSWDRMMPFLKKTIG